MPHLIANTILIPEIAHLIKEGRDVTFTPGGVSMRPFIEGGKDCVLLTRPEHLRVGDIILAEVENDRYVLHRLIRLDGDAVTLMGDGNLYGEEHCMRQDVLAKVAAIHSPKGRRKPMTRGRIWLWLLPVRRYLLKVYRHTPRIL
ncbi:MAG: S24/S26 family peptidase [Paludibacteraceae bacterium]|nr:S24/S26 family peptidase [Paludibacteraceae bacterium]